MFRFSDFAGLRILRIYGSDIEKQDRYGFLAEKASGLSCLVCLTKGDGPVVSFPSSVAVARTCLRLGLSDTGSCFVGGGRVGFV